MGVPSYYEIMTRRRFLEAWQALAAFLAGLLILPPLLFWWKETRTENSELWLKLGQSSKIPEGKWLRKGVALERKNRWRRDTVRGIIYLLRRGKQFKVVTSVCPHAACNVRLNDEGFYCPCHQSYFDGDGRPTEGPSPRSLDELEWKIEGEELFVKYQQFRSGLKDKQAIG